MALRLGTTVGNTTGAPSIEEQIARFKLRDLPEPSSAQDAINQRLNRKGDGKKTTAQETLKDKCMGVIVKNFASRPVDEGACSAELMRMISSKLPTDLDPAIGALHVFDEGYWKRCCVEKLGWSRCELASHGQVWKQLYFEALAQEVLESFSGDDSPDRKGGPSEKQLVIRRLLACQDYIFSLTVKELRSHVSMLEVLPLLPNLTRLTFTLGINKCGMSHVRSSFGLKVEDAQGLSSCLVEWPQCCPCLTSLALPRNLIDDDLLKILMEGLYKNECVTSLDLSHNKISNAGVRMVSKLLGKQSILTTLDLSDNRIRAEGGRYLARGLRTNDSLVELNLRMNRLGDEGGVRLVDGLRSSPSSGLMRLNLAANGLGKETANSLAGLLAGEAFGPELLVGAPNLSVLDLSCNELASSDANALERALGENHVLTALDLRGNTGIGPEADSALDAIGRHVRANELAPR